MVEVEDVVGQGVAVGMHVVVVMVEQFVPGVHVVLVVAVVVVQGVTAGMQVVELEELVA